jgi:hypothetical protein
MSSFKIYTLRRTLLMCSNLRHERVARMAEINAFRMFRKPEHLRVDGMIILKRILHRV